MKLTIHIPDDLYDSLETIAAKTNLKTVNTLVEKNIHLLTDITNGPRIVLEKQHLARMSDSVGGKVFKTADDVSNVFVNNLRIKIGDASVTLRVEDAHAIRDHFDATGRVDYEQYVSDTINEALAEYLWGSTQGLIGR